ncbi:MAG: LAGLIDADG family homing endonuclease [Candidatus Bathyarchaeia archaeon]
MRTRVKPRGVVYHPPRKELDEDVALLLGLHVGDGWLSDKWGITCEPKDKSMTYRVTQLVRDVLGVEPIKPCKCKAGKAIMIRSGQRQALDFFRNYGLPQGRKAGRVQIPKQILESSNKAVTKAFLRGLFSTDGCFSFQISRGPRVEIQVKSEKLRDDFIYLAGQLGFSFRSYKYLPPRGKNKAPLHVAYTTQSRQVVRWMEEIGSIKDSHIQQYQHWKKIIETKRS